METNNLDRQPQTDRSEFRKKQSIFFSYQTFLYLLLLLRDEHLWNTARWFLRRNEQIPHFRHEDPGVLAVQESRQVDLHAPRVRILNENHTDALISNKVNPSRTGTGARQEQSTVNNFAAKKKKEEPSTEKNKIKFTF